jgi:transglutaminase-like putative cysteine protease
VTTIEVPGREVRFDRASASASLDRPLEKGDLYRVTAQTVIPAADELRRVEDVPLAGGTYTELPPDMPERIHEIASELTAGLDNRFDRVKAIEDYLRSSEFTYDPTTHLRGGTNSILQFLDETKAGFCQQFSFTMAVLLRDLGIDSRIVVGFSSGGTSSPGVPYPVMSDQAHSWVEVYFDGYGWLPFEPTPTRSNPAALYPTRQSTCPGGPDCPDGGQGDLGPGGSAEEGIGTSQRERIEGDPRLGTAPPPIPLAPPIRGEDPIVTAPRVLLGAVILGVLFLLLVPPIRAFRRRVRIRRVGNEPRRLILVTYEHFVERATGLGLGRAPGQTFEEYRRKVAATGYLSDGRLDRLTRLATSAAYSPHEPDAGQAAEAGDAADVAIKEIRRAVGPSRWIVGLYRRR